MKSGVIIAVLGGAGIAVAIAMLANNAGKANKRAVVRNAENSDAWKVIVDHMTDSEIDVMYDYLTKYFSAGVPVPQGSPLAMQLLTINAKYNIDT
jgi:hypothetical protein